MMPPLIAAIECVITTIASSLTVGILIFVFKGCRKAELKSSPIFWTLMMADFFVALFHLPHAIFWGLFFFNAVGGLQREGGHLEQRDHVAHPNLGRFLRLLQRCPPRPEDRNPPPPREVQPPRHPRKSILLSAAYVIAFDFIERQPPTLIKDCFNTNCEVPRGHLSTFVYLYVKVVYVLTDVLLGFFFLVLLHRRNIKSFSINFRWSVVFMKYLFLFHFFLVLIPFLIDLVILNTVSQYFRSPETHPLFSST
ncbi:hypothetical protein L596_006941 [Steinernema carpocapsae]|uniref:Uncharacterized protein n=1 Tax=Steinernema carpocapsae TaxID=34508 RepID=A0A4U5P853_STECR|nr:hypothetical protein L596_006941 [Steinernema carpocapsae]